MSEPIILSEPMRAALQDMQRAPLQRQRRYFVAPGGGRHQVQVLQALVRRDLAVIKPTGFRRARASITRDGARLFAEILR